MKGGEKPPGMGGWAMYTVYLIDDEKWALYDVQHTCPFAEYGFSVAGAQTNPFAALDEVIELRPDAVFVDVRMPPREEFTFFGLSESLEMSAMRPMGHRPKANSAAIKIQPPTSTSFFFFVFPPLSSKRNEPVSGSYSKSLLIYLFSFFLPALAARSRSKSTIFVFLPVFSSST